MKLKIGYALGLKRAICLFASTAALLSVNGQEYDWHSRPKNEAIHFEDPNVLAIFIKHGVDTNGDRAISYAEAAAVTDVEDWFRQSVITKFDEFKYFTGVTSIERTAFATCRNLTSITIPNNVKSIGDKSFIFCESLKKVTIPYGVTSIGAVVFDGCENLASISLPDSVTIIGTGAFLGCTNLSSITIPRSVTEIRDKAFMECSRLTSIVIPANVTTIGEGVFAGCANMERFEGKFASADNRCLIADGKLIAFAPAGLTKYVIPDSVTSIGNWAFGWYSSLTSVTISDSVTGIGERAFSGCSSLTSITIPYGVTSIGQRVFYDCDRLQDVYCKSVTPPAIGKLAFFCSESYPARNIYVPTDSVDAYKSAEGWNVYSQCIIGYDF